MRKMDLLKLGETINLNLTIGKKHYNIKTCMATLRGRLISDPRCSGKFSNTAPKTTTPEAK